MSYIALLDHTNMQDTGQSLALGFRHPGPSQYGQEESHPACDRQMFGGFVDSRLSTTKDAQQNPASEAAPRGCMDCILPVFE